VVQVEAVMQRMMQPFLKSKLMLLKQLPLPRTLLQVPPLLLVVPQELQLLLP